MEQRTEQRSEIRSEHGSEKHPHNPKCPLSDTHYCELLNMQSCKTCTIGGCGDTPEQVMNELAYYERELLPEGGIAHLFLDHRCQFCKTEPRGERQGYAILDMAHPHPKRIQRKMYGERIRPVGIMIPVQLSICSHCRRRLLWIDMLPLLVPIVTGLAWLFVSGIDAVKEPLLDIASWLPFGIWVAVLLLGWFTGKHLANALAREAEKTMYVEVTDHPVICEMIEKGWFPIARENGTKLLFSKSRRVRGLGTAVLQADHNIHKEDH